MNKEFDTPVDRSGTMALKWDVKREQYQNPDILPFWIADADYPTSPEIISALEDRVKNGIYGYSSADIRYLDSVRNWYHSRYGLEIEKEWILPSIGVVTVLSYAIKAFTKTGDTVVVQSPIYGPFYKIVHRNQRTLRDCPMLLRDGTYGMDYDALEQAFRDGARMMLLCNPHNPVGRVWTREELSRLQELCRRYDVYLVSDEIHGDLALYGRRYTSVLEQRKSGDRVLVCTAPSKTFNVAGLCASNAFIPDVTDREKINILLEGDMIMGPNAMGLCATEAAYRTGGAWLDRQLRHLEGNIAYFQKRICEKMPEIGLFDHQGTYLVWTDFRAFGLEEKELLDILGHRFGLAPGGGADYGAAYSGYLRWNMACPRSMLEEGMNRLTEFYYWVTVKNL